MNSKQFIWIVAASVAAGLVLRWLDGGRDNEQA